MAVSGEEEAFQRLFAGKYPMPPARGTTAGIIEPMTVDMDDDGSEDEDVKVSVTVPVTATPKLSSKATDSTVGITKPVALFGDVDTKWTSGHQVLSTIREDSALSGIFAAIPKDKREHLSSVNLAKLKSKAEEGTKNKFVLMKSILSDSGTVDADKVLMIRSVEDQKEDWSDALRASDMLDVFTTIPSAFTDWVHDGKTVKVPSADATVKSLFSKLTRPTLEAVRQHGKWVQQMCPMFMVENLMWSATKLKNSCDDELWHRIKEEAELFPESERTGPVLFCIALELIESKADEMIESLCYVLKNIKLSDIPGEKVSTLVSILKECTEQLTRTNNLPVGSFLLVANALKSCSTSEFKSMMEHVINSYQAPFGAKPSLKDMFEVVNKRYHELVLGNKWVATTGQGSGGTKGTYETAFNAQERDYSQYTCYTCGETGHVARDCKSGKPSTSGRGGGRGFGRGGRGRGQGGRVSGRQGSGGVRDPMRMPPKPNEPREKMINGRKLMWCGPCNQWKDHSTEQHRANKATEKDKDEGKRGNSTNAPSAAAPPSVLRSGSGDGAKKVGFVNTVTEPGTVRQSVGHHFA
jgi:hypothetical protein